MKAFNTFLASNSGYVSRRNGLSLGWMAGALAGVATAFAVPQVASADACGGIPPGQCSSSCSGDVCQTNPPMTWRVDLCRDYPSGQCYEVKYCTCSV